VLRVFSALKHKKHAKTRMISAFNISMKHNTHTTLHTSCISALRVCSVTSQLLASQNPSAELARTPKIREAKSAELAQNRVQNVKLAFWYAADLEKLDFVVFTEVCHREV
jgi:hypothetical protein